jgi:hypothetical protein
VIVRTAAVLEALDGLTSVVSTYVTQARDGDNAPASIHIPEEALDALNSIADSFKRIADAVAAKQG